jgi:uncharacterized protein (DUF1684 family)
MKIFIVAVVIFFSKNIFAQNSYKDSLQTYINDYVSNHEVVKGKDKKYFRFFPVDETYRVTADFAKANNSTWFSIQTSGQQRKMYRVFGTITFTIHDTIVKANLYQAQSLLSDPKYKDYLVLMFTDKTTGNETYEAGRYIDFTIDDIKNNTLTIDFNKAYNPYCAYVKNQYNCPIPPRENNLPVAIEAGEKDYGKKVE